MLNAYVDAAKTADKYVTFPLDLAIKCEQSDAIILVSLTKNIEASEIHDKMGILPLHKAIKQKMCGSTILCTLEVNRTIPRSQMNREFYLFNGG